MWIGLLGRFEMRAAGAHVAVPAAKQRVVLAALALLARQAVSYDELETAVWGQAPPAGARATLRNYVKRLRRAAGSDAGRIRTRDPGYLLDVADTDVDVHEFVTLFRAGDEAYHASKWQRAADTLAAGLALWRDRPLADVPSAHLRAQWCPQLDEMRLQALEWRAGAELRLGPPEPAIAELRRLTAEHGLREGLWELLMLALHQAGRPADAIQAYQQARRLLAEELGVAPGPRLARLHEQIRAGAGADAVETVPRRLPATVPGFAGRAAELRLLDQMTPPAPAGQTVVISAIGGTAGVGKTALAVHFAHQVAERFPDGQLYLNLRGFGPSGEPVTPAQALPDLLNALGVPAGRIPGTQQAQASLYRSTLAGKRMLILLDNARDADQVRPLLPGTAGTAVLVTSRNQLTGLAVTHGARLLSLDLLTDAEARDLLALRLGTEALAGQPEAIAELIALCDRLPLALTVAAALAARPDRTVTRLVADLRDARARLGVLDGDLGAGGVRVVFSWSYLQLSAAAARMFRLLGLHCDPDISLSAAASLAGIASPRARALLGELAGAHLIVEHKPGRWTLHDLLRVYAAELAQGEDDERERHAAARRVLDHYLFAVHTCARKLYPARDPQALNPVADGVTLVQPDGDDEALSWLDSESRCLIAAVHDACSAGLARHAWQLTSILAEFLDTRGYWDDWASAARAALAAARSQDDVRGVAHSLRALGAALIRLGARDEARAHLLAARAEFRRAGDQIGQGRAGLDLSMLAGQAGDEPAALEFCEEALSMFAQANSNGLGRALNAVGWHLARTGGVEQGITMCERAVGLCASVGDRTGAAAAWDSLGYCHGQLGDYPTAIACYGKAVELTELTGARYYQADTLTRLGDTLRDAGELAAAVDTWWRAWVLLDDLCHPDADAVRAKAESFSRRAPASG